MRLDDDTLSSIDLITRVRTEEARKLEKRLRLKEESKAARVQQATSSPFESALDKRLGKREEMLIQGAGVH